MDRAGQDEDRRFEGGIFSGYGVSQGTMPQGRMAQGREPQNRTMNQQPYCGCNGCCGRCPRKKDNSQTMLVILAVAAIGALFLAFLITILCLAMVVSEKKGNGMDIFSKIYEETVPMLPASPEIPYGQEVPYEQQTPYDQQTPYGQEQPNVPDNGASVIPYGDWSSKVPGDGNTAGEDEYYTELQDAIRTDLSYTIEWKNYEYAGNSENVMIVIDYPVIQGNVPNRNILNKEITEEIQYFEDYYAEYSKYMLPEEFFAVYSEGFVTYMDEDIMSVVFCETVYTDYWMDCGLYCINIDMENGVVLDNSSIIEIDDAFAVDFRTKSREQNGAIAELEYLSDQEIAHYLSNAGTSILFYTPMGMEIGLNYGESYVTVTYKDYEKYLQRY